LFKYTLSKWRRLRKKTTRRAFSVISILLENPSRGVQSYGGVFSLPVIKFT
jgi:hypothetical protein